MNFSSSMRLKSACAAGIFFALVYFVLAWNRIDGQGLYYDELHQVPAAFSYIGKPQQMFSIGLGKIPLFNMSYSGAIKSAVYGAYLRCTGKGFSLYSWRALGVGFVMAGIVLFSVLGRSAMTLFELSAFFLLLLSDVTIVLATRHDWGPAALALFLRLLFLAVVVRARNGSSVRSRNTFMAAALVGFSIFEKLSSVVMLIPLALIIFFDKRRHSARHFTVAVAGLTTGLLPLLIANIGSFLLRGKFISLLNTADPSFATHRNFGYFVWGILSQANGKLIENFILGQSGPLPEVIEVVLLSTVMLIITVLSLRAWSTTQHMPLWGVMALCYFGVGVGLTLLPRSEWVHHWIIATPFQYCAIALWVVDELHKKHSPGRSARLLRVARSMCLGAIALLFIFRIPSVYSEQRSLSRAEASSTWDSSFTRIADFARCHSDHCAFIASQWGIGVQILCMGNGQRDLLYEPFWNYRRKGDLETIVRTSKKDTFYLVSLSSNEQETNPTEQSIRRDASLMALWQEVAASAEENNFKALRIKKFTRH